ncbi:MAG: thiamine pyrophosphate-dependent enzyme, partial [Solirubrobacterales bacterium]
AVTERIAAAERDPDWAREWLGAAAAARRAIEAQLAALEGPTEPGLQQALGAAYGDGDLVYTASSMPIRDQEAFLPPGAAEVTFLANRGANGIDGLVSSGIGAAAASARPTWIVTGDLGLFHDANGLVLARGAEVPLRVVVVNNGGGGIFDFLPQAKQLDPSEFEALLGTPTRVDLEQVAGLHGLRYERLERLERLADAAGTDAVLIEVPVPDRPQNVTLHRRIVEAAVAAVGEGGGT